MKLSLSWIFDHIVGNWQQVDMPAFVEKFNRTTAAIEHYYPFELSIDQMTLVHIKKVYEDQVVVFSLEWQKTVEIPGRVDAAPGRCFLIKSSEKAGLEWVTLSDFGASAKQGLFPAVFCPTRQQAGAWKKNIERHDYILELDNPSITNRPDLWGMRGIARECAALLDFKLKPLKTFLHDIDHQDVSASVYESKDGFSIINSAPQACNRFAGLYVSDIDSSGCIISVAQRLCKVDQRPVGALVDCANYVMLDLGQPLHTFDAKKIGTKVIKPRMAHAGEKITLLDGAQLTLSAQDLVVSNGETPMALAGIMGGISTAVDEKTTDIFIESANFNGAVIRATSARYHVRTEASARFEKNLDPNQVVDAIKRMIKLLAQAKVAHTISTPLVVVGSPLKPYHIEVSHKMIEQRLGITLTPARVLSVLRSIGFVVTKKKAVYHVEVPTFRGVKGVTIAEDIVEEVGRLVGLDTIVYTMPYWRMKPNMAQHIMRGRAIKQHLAFALHMHEVHNYPFFDERFLEEIKWQPVQAIRAKNPLSTNVTRLVTSLVPHLYQNVQQNVHKHEQLRFFECSRIWHLAADNTAVERKTCAGILWQTKNVFDFYTGKRELTTLFELLGITVEWVKAEKQIAAWYDKNQFAQLVSGDRVIGYAGMSDRAFAHEQLVGSGFVFELMLDELNALAYSSRAFKPLCKYPYVYLDISLLVSLEHSVQSIEQLICAVDEKIYDVELVDMFFKDEWRDQRSLTFRYYMRDQTETLAKEAIDKISIRVVEKIKSIGAQVR